MKIALKCIPKAGFVAVFATTLFGCSGGAGNTLPSPKEKLPTPNFQIRLADVVGETQQVTGTALSGGAVGITGAGESQTNVQGAASGCVLTTLGDPPGRITARLVTAGGCVATVTQKPLVASEPAHSE